MKLRSGRQNKNDLSNALDILAEHEKNGKPTTLERIHIAMFQSLWRLEHSAESIAELYFKCKA